MRPQAQAERPSRASTSESNNKAVRQKIDRSPLVRFTLLLCYCIKSFFRCAATGICEMASSPPVERSKKPCWARSRCRLSGLSEERATPPAKLNKIGRLRRSRRKRSSTRFRPSAQGWLLRVRRGPHSIAAPSFEILPLGPFPILIIILLVILICLSSCRFSDRRLQHQVVVITHQAIRMHLPSGLLTSLGQGLEEIVPIHIAQENIFAAVSTAHYMVDGPSIFDARRATASITPRNIFKQKPIYG